MKICDFLVKKYRFSHDRYICRDNFCCIIFIFSKTLISQSFQVTFLKYVFFIFFISSVGDEQGRSRAIISYYVMTYFAYIKAHIIMSLHRGVYRVGQNNWTLLYHSIPLSHSVRFFKTEENNSFLNSILLLMPGFFCLIVPLYTVPLFTDF